MKKSIINTEPPILLDEVRYVVKNLKNNKLQEGKV